MRRLVALAITTSLAWVGTASAQGETERGAAETLFTEARALMSQGKFAEACPKLASSYQLDPGLGTLLNLGLCYKSVGRIGSAWSTFREAAMLGRRNGESAREAVARQEAEALAPRVGKLRLVLEPALARTSGLEVRLDGSLIPIGALTTPLPVDAGEHLVQASAPDKRPWEGKITTRDAAVTSLRLTALANAPAAKKPLAETNPGSTQRITALAVGSLGIASLGVAGFFALSAQSSYSDSNSLCRGTGVCKAEGTKLRQDAKSKGTTATLFAGAGAVALASAAVLWFTAPAREKPVQTKSARVFIRPHSAAWGLELGSVW